MNPPIPETRNPIPGPIKLRLDSIDALRGVAALMVAGYHIWGHYGVYPFPSLGVVPWTKGAGMLAYVTSPLRWGYLGVGLFLVLSGFCIHLPFARKAAEAGSYKFEWRKFYLRRLWRLYPAYAVSVVGTYLLLVITAHGTDYVEGSPTVLNLISHLTLTHGYFDRYFYGIVHVYWSLALEFQLYLMYPLFLYLFRKMGLTRSIAMLTIFAIAWRLISMQYFGSQLISVAWTGPYAMMGFVFSRMPEWLFGAWLAEWFVKGANLTAKRVPLVTASAAVLFAAILTTLWQPTWLLTDIVFGLGFALLIAGAIVPSRKVTAEAKSWRWSPYRFLVWSGTISYSIYLFHMQLSWFGNPWIRTLNGDALQFVLRIGVLVLSIPIIAFIFRFVEAPFMNAPKPGTRLFKVYIALGRMLGIKSDTISGSETGRSPVVQLGTTST